MKHGLVLEGMPPSWEQLRTCLAGSKFLAQHATATCCRGCLFKWHGIPAGRPLSDAEVEHVVSCLLAWIRGKAGDLSRFPMQETLPI